MKNPRTTIAGITTIVGGVLLLVGSGIAARGIPPMEAWSAFGAAIVAGYGLIAAADGKKPGE